ncbi:cytochrome P450 3A17 [Microdochium bolleyi]|uniref:Cytochrome P450 3A17 n=1 Tax=Microdochium bolleyi TaxID=196109 RepID=A0A136IZM8_9PEZI|nr:cytochrome P450 3A17 [Microdochium bolleyi]
MDTSQESQISVLGGLVSSSATTLAVLGFLPIAAIAAKAVYNIWFHPLSAFPGPKLYAVTELSLNWQNNVRGTFLPRLQELHRQYGPIVRTGPNALSVDGGIAWPQVYAHRSGKPEYPKLAGYFGPENDKSIIMAPRDNHRRQRRHLAHAFSEAALTEQQAYVLKYVNLIMNKFSEHADQAKNLNIVDWLNFMTFDIIGDLAFGESFGSLSQDGYHPWVRSVIDSVYGFSLAHFIKFHPIFTPIFPFVVGTRFFKQIRIVQDVSKTKAQARMDQGEAPGGRRDIMTYVTRGKNSDGEQGMTHEEQLIVVPLLVTAGSDTTATALCGFFFLLGQHPNAMSHLQREVRKAFEDETEIDIKSSARLQYLHACIEETLRLFPPAVEVPPRVSPGAEIDGRWVPKGTRITTPQYVTHRNPSHFKDPDSFHPERWLQASHPLYDPRYAGDNRSVFKPFSFGPRDCLGKNLAYAEMRIFAARLMLQFDWELLPGQDEWMSKQKVTVTWQKGPLMVKFHQRKE